MGSKKSCVLILALCFPISIFAETIVLKSGKTVEGKVIEKTDKYIKIDFMGVPITYFNDEIDLINGTKSILSNSDVNPILTESKQQARVLTREDLIKTKEVSDKSSQQSDPIAFSDWYQSKEVSDYLSKANSLSKKEEGVMSQFKSSFEQAMKNNDHAEGERVLNNMSATLSTIIANLRSINPPPEFKNYHNKIIESYNHLKMFFEGMKNYDTSYMNYFMASKTSMIGALETLKKIYSNHKAPPEAYAMINSQLASLNSR